MPSFFTKIIEAVRNDSWANLQTGLGTERDKTVGTFYQPGYQLSQEQLANLYRFNSLARRIIEVPPKEALKGLLRVEGFQEQDEEVNKYLKPFQLTEKVVNAWIFARAFGGCTLWPVANDGLPLEEPLDELYSDISTIKTIDRRFLGVDSIYEEGPKIGEPEIYTCGKLDEDRGSFKIHESRLVFFPGARTEDTARIQNGYWDDSVLQACYDELASTGEIWKSIQWLISDSNQAIFKIKNLWAKVTQGDKESLLARFQLLDLMRSIGRAIALDYDDEDFKREPTSFQGLPELSDRGWKVLAAASEIPVTVLMGESPAGLNATGASDLEWFYNRLEAERVQRFQPPIERLVTILLNAGASPTKVDVNEDFEICWPPIRPPTEKEKAEIYYLLAQGDDKYIQNETVLPEEVALLRMSKYDSMLKLPRESLAARERILKTDFDSLIRNQRNATSGIGGGFGGGDAGESGVVSPDGDLPPDLPPAPKTSPSNEIPAPPESSTYNRWGEPPSRSRG